MRKHLSNPWVALSIILIAVVVIYSNIYEVPFAFDGGFQIVNNPKIRDLKNYFLPVSLFSSRPLVGLTFALNYEFGRLNVFGYHLVNVLIHVINGFLVYFLALTIFRKFSRLSDRKPSDLSGQRSKLEGERGKAPDEISQFSIFNFQFSIPMMSLFTALIFVAHPIQTQAVTYTVQRYTSMAGMFYFLSVLFYIRARLLAEGSKLKAQGLGSSSLSAFSFRLSAFYALFVLCGLLALLSKQNTVSLPLAILLVEYLLFDRTWQGWKRKLTCFVPAFLLFGVFILYVSGLFRGGIQMGSLLEDVSGILRAHGPAVSPWIYLCTQFDVLVIYIRLLFLPIGQNLDYMYPFKSGFFDGYTPLAFLFLVGIVSLGIWNLKKRPVITFGICWFFITLSVESSIFPISDAMFEHRLYLPMFGFALVVAYLIFQPLSKRQTEAVVISIAIIVVLGTATYLRNRVWRDHITLWSDVISKNPKNYRGHNNLGKALGHQGRLKEGISHYSEALRLKPDFAYAHNNLGNALTRHGNFDKAIGHLTEALRLKPKFLEAYNNLGVAMVAKGSHKEAIRCFSEALRIEPEFAGAHNSLANVLAQEGRLKEAIRHWSEAMKIMPDYAEPHYNLGIILERRGALKKAARHFSEAIRIRPDYAKAHSNLGLILVRQRDFDGAISHFSKALEIEPGLSQARRGLEMSLKLKGSRSN